MKWCHLCVLLSVKTIVAIILWIIIVPSIYPVSQTTSRAIVSNNYCSRVCTNISTPDRCLQKKFSVLYRKIEVLGFSLLHDFFTKHLCKKINLFFMTMTMSLHESHSLQWRRRENILTRSYTNLLATHHSFPHLWMFAVCVCNLFLTTRENVPNFNASHNFKKCAQWLK